MVRGAAEAPAPARAAAAELTVTVTTLVIAPPLTLVMDLVISTAVGVRRESRNRDYCEIQPKDG